MKSLLALFLSLASFAVFGADAPPITVGVDAQPMGNYDRILAIANTLVRVDVFPLQYQPTLSTIPTCSSHIDPILTHYVIVRSDLPLGILAAQVVHAAGESSPGNLNAGTNAVVLAVPDEPALLDVEQALRRAGIECVAIHEPDAPWNGQLLSIGLAPIADRRRVKPILSRLPLLGKNENIGAAGRRKLSPELV